MRPNLRQIEAFLAVAEHGQFSRAAERLGTTQPALSLAVRDLEAILGLRLFDRTTRRVDLTEAGAAFRDEVANSVAELDRAVRRARERADLRRGHLRIAAPPLLAAMLLPPALAAFRVAHGGITCALADVGTDEIMARVRAGRADLGVGTFPPGEPDLDRRLILRDALMVFGLPGGVGPGADGEPCRWRDLAGKRIITLTRDSGLRLLAELGFERAGMTLRPAWEVTQVATALALAAAGEGLALLPGYAATAGRSHGLTAACLTDPVIGREVVIVQARDRAPPPAAAAFAEFLLRFAVSDGRLPTHGPSDT